MLNSEVITGIALVLVFNFLSAGKGVLLGSLLQKLHPAFMLATTFSLVAIFFNLIVILRRGLKPWFGDLRKNRTDVIIINLTTVGSWFSFFYAMKNLEPAVASTLCNGVGPIVTVALAGVFRPNSQVNLTEKICSLGVFAGVIFQIGMIWTGNTGFKSAAIDSTFLGMGLAVLCGLCNVLTTFFSKRFNENGWKSDQIMAGRFFALIALAFFLMPQESVSWMTSSSILLDILLISFFGIVLPLYSLLQGIQRLEPIAVSLILSTVPLFVLAIQTLDHRLEFSIYSLIGALMVISFSALGTSSRVGRNGILSVITALWGNKLRLKLKEIVSES
jgi:drug/metabolite transporter (DMT)-like permease